MKLSEHYDEITGWRAVRHDGEVVETVEDCITAGVVKLEANNAALLEALEIAFASVEWMADATDADPEDIERRNLVEKAIQNGTMDY